MKTITFKGGPIDGEIRAIEYDDQQTFFCYLNMGEWVSKHTYREDLLNPSFFDHVCADYRFIVETDQPDEQGTVINLDGIEIGATTPICLNFGRDLKDVIGHAHVWGFAGKLWCQAELLDKFLDLNPAIGFEVIKWENRPTGKYYDRIKLFSIGLCTAPNLNPAIKTIREQLKSQG
jgi:hypothetical protein